MSLSTLRTRLTERLRPVEAWRPDEAAVRSDLDLNPGLTLPEGPLRAAAVLILVVARPGGATLVLTRRSDRLREHRGQIAFPGGRLEPGETAVQAALREAGEEVALDPGRVEVLGLGDAYRTGTGFLITPVVGWAEPPLDLTADPNEVAEVFEVPWDHLMDAANHARGHLDPPEGPRRFFWTTRWEERDIWGVTAGVVRGLWSRLYEGEVGPDGAMRADAA